MLRSMFAGVSGLRGHQTMMDVVGDNISNVNTPGFKQSRVNFQEALAQTMRAATGAGEDVGGTNPYQIGLGVDVAGTDTVFSQGSSQTTGRNTDLLIDGDGFFALDDGAGTSYTRSGAFTLDEDGTLVSGNGGRLQGWNADDDGEIDTDGETEALQVPSGDTIPPSATGEIRLAGNLDGGAESGEGDDDADSFTTSITIYDDNGGEHEIMLEFERLAGGDEGEWEVTATGDAEDGDGDLEHREVGRLSFGDNGGGELQWDDDDDGTLSGEDVVGLFDGLEDDEFEDEGITFDISGLSQAAGSNTAEARGQDGYGIGFLRGFEFGSDGTVTGRYSNGESLPIGRVAIATFDNPEGLERQGESMYAATVNSGEPILGAPGEGEGGSLTPGALEMSNVDLAEEFTNLIIAQRGFQANSRSITTSDEMLQELIQMKR